MLIEFELSNFRSIRAPQTLSMVASPIKELPQNLCKSDFNPNLNLLRSAVVYGANAAGKSNLIRSLHFMKWFIVNSARESQQGDEIDVDSFLLNEKTRNKPSQFEVTFSKNEVRYQYGFSLDRNRIIEEWLLAYPSGRVQQWFVRKYDKTLKQFSWKFSKFFTGKKQLWTDSTRDNALFLSTAVQLNNKQLTPVFEWFQKDLLVIPAFGRVSGEESIKQLENPEGKEKILRYLSIADPSISDISLEFKKVPVDKIPDDIPKHVKEDLSKKGFPKIDCMHPENAILRLNDESHGTQKLFGFSGYWIDALEKGKVLVIDELDNSLHPLAVRFLISLIQNEDTNKNNAQLFFSTHDTSLIDSDIFRRDQIWFVERDKEHSTQLYPLLDFSPRKDEAIGRGYLQGRYGALPYIGEWSF